jgi:hypothetical protein
MKPRQAPIRRVGKKLAARLRIYYPRAKIWLKVYPWCQVIGCSARADDVHHKKLRGKYLLDETTWMSICRDHHALIKAMPRWARANGYLLR